MWEILAVGYVLKPVYISFFVYRKMDVYSGDVLDLHGILERVEIDNFIFRWIVTTVSTLLHEGTLFDKWKIRPAHISHIASRKQDSIMKM